MKALFVSILILSCVVSRSQDSTWITTFNLKAGTIRFLVDNIIIDQSTSGTFLKWSAGFDDENPVDNANVQIDSIRTVLVAFLYQRLMEQPAGLIKKGADFVSDFTTSIQSKRNDNSMLDRLCDGIELFYENTYNSKMTNGNKIIRGK